MEVWAATKQENGHWLFAWTAGASDPFDIYLDGVLLDSVEGGSFEAEVEGYDTAPPPLEIVEEDADAESILYPPYALLQWRGLTGADAYVVEKYVSGDWQAMKTVMEVAAGYYTYRTRLIDDCEETSFRVTALDLRGNEGTPITFTFNVVRNPAPPDIEFTMTGGDIVVSAT